MLKFHKELDFHLPQTQNCLLGGLSLDKLGFWDATHFNPKFHYHFLGGGGVCFGINYRRAQSRGGGSSPIFLCGCATSGSRTPPFDKARQRRNFDPVLRQILEKVSKKCLTMYDSLDLRKILHLKLAKHAFFRGETSIFSKIGPFCKAILGPKRDPFVRQNFKCGPLCTVHAEIS